MKKTYIQWTNATVNFWTGCRKISPGCKFCYMFRDKERYGQEPTTIIRTKPNTFYSALKWKESRKIFTNSWSDFFIEEGDAWRADAWDVIRRTPQHQWQILTKRPDRIKQCLPEDWGNGWDNVWIGVSAENQEYADKRIPVLLSIPAKIRFVSCEPLIGRIDLTNYLQVDNGLHWIIGGGESGNNIGKYLYRKSEIEWYTFLINQCHDAGVKVFIKQLGTHLSKELKLTDRHGGVIEEWQSDLQVREFPEYKNLPTIV